MIFEVPIVVIVIVRGVFGYLIKELTDEKLFQVDTLDKSFFDFLSSL